MRLKKIRANSGLSVAKLAALSGVPLRTIQEVERRDACSVSTALKLSKALNVTLDELCKEKPEP
jgi:transcriptional regulator with XRE-family HTH domain